MLRAMPAGQKWHDSVLLIGRKSSKTQGLKLIRTKEEKETPFLIYPLDRKEQAAVKTICWEQRHRPCGIPKSKTSAQESLLALRSVFQTPLLPLAWRPKHWTSDSDTLARVEREGLRDSNNEDIRQLGTPLCTNTHIDEKLHLQLSDALKKALEGSRFF